MTATATRVRFHLSLNVADLGKAVAFYRTLFGLEPAKLRPDYAKFEPDDPPLVLSLEPTPRPVGGPLNHLGFRMPDAASLVAMQARLEAAGIQSNREDGVECCYAKQTKFWVTDPDGTLWEVYTFEGDIDHRGSGQAVEAMVPDGKPAIAAQVVWEHRLGSPVPERIPLADGTADEVRLRGSFNVALPDAERRHLLQEAARVLKPGGRVFAHTLTAEKPVVGPPDLPGPAATVRHTPPEAEPPALLEAAGFAGVRLVKFDAGPCFVRNGVGMREQQVEGFKPAGGGGTVEVLYKGPYRQVTDDAGTVYPRGRRVRVPAAAAAVLGDGFVVFPAEAAAGRGCG
jgi:catechol 2,3-dioxygenase-like lactoylglutathione lyase family enzyme